MAKDKLKDNLQKGKLYVFIANMLSGILFLWAYFHSGIIWFLVAALTNFIVIIATLWFFKKVEKRYERLLNLKSHNARDKYDER